MRALPHLRPPRPCLPLQLSISQLHRLLLQATWLILFVQVPKARGGGGSFSQQVEAPVFVNNTLPLQKAKVCEGEREQTCETVRPG